MRCLFVVVSLLATAPALAKDASADVAGRYSAWQRCLGATLHGQPPGLGDTAAVKAALDACGRSEAAYLETLAASPLFDAEEIYATRITVRARATDTLMIAVRDRLDPVATGSIGPRPPQRRP